MKNLHVLPPPTIAKFNDDLSNSFFNDSPFLSMKHPQIRCWVLLLLFYEIKIGEKGLVVKEILIKI